MRLFFDIIPSTSNGEVEGRSIPFLWRRKYQFTGAFKFNDVQVANFGVFDRDINGTNITMKNLSKAKYKVRFTLLRFHSVRVAYNLLLVAVPPGVGEVGNR